MATRGSICNSVFAWVLIFPLWEVLIKSNFLRSKVGGRGGHRREAQLALGETQVPQGVTRREGRVRKTGGWQLKRAWRAGRRGRSLETAGRRLVGKHGERPRGAQTITSGHTLEPVQSAVLLGPTPVFEQQGGCAQWGGGHPPAQYERQSWTWHRRPMLGKSGGEGRGQTRSRTSWGPRNGAAGSPPGLLSASLS